MARYNREFLVPYLNDVLSVELFLAKMQKRLNQINSEIARNKAVINKYKKPELGKAPDVWPEAKYIGGGCCLFGGLLIGVLALAFQIFAIITGVLLAAGILLIIEGHSERETEREYEETRREYEVQLAAYDNHQEARNEAYSMLKDYEKQQKALSDEIYKLTNLRNELYNVNVIPKRYRDLYTVLYLFDWFSTSAADDLDHALSMFVLEEIRDSLDTMIQNQATMILNQRIMIAKQQESVDQLNRHNQIMRDKLNRLQATEEERLRYEKMIESNTAMNAYFAAANYLK